ncbi:hypothetical protein, partial [Caballeronia sp. GAFFF1]|uniref:hypothetical protein n=1 Tax=Caballeronia sp. GAFFF1 TaxID=2921779 RepID=UPI0020277BB2
YSHIDNQHQFGLVFNDVKGYDETYIRWVYYYLGVNLGIRNFRLYPFQLECKYKVYKCCNDAQRQSKLIVNAINKKLNQEP